jgi:hypothetical protein
MEAVSMEAAGAPTEGAGDSSHEVTKP